MVTERATEETSQVGDPKLRVAVDLGSTYAPPRDASEEGRLEAVPWEAGSGGAFARCWATVAACHRQPRALFAAASRSEGVKAVTFSIMAFTIAGVVAAFWLSLWLMMELAVRQVTDISRPTHGLDALWMSPLGRPLLIVIGAAAYGAIAPFVAGAIQHGVLKLLRGTGPDKGWMHSVRVAAYAGGSGVVWLAVPAVGAIPALVFGLKHLLQGLDETHRCGIGKALAAVVVSAFAFTLF